MAETITGTPTAQNALSKYASAIQSIQGGEAYEPERIGVPAGDPLRPADFTSAPGGFTHNPPKCPKCSALLYPLSTNSVGDMLFQCLNARGMNICGYDAVYRVASNTWEPRPNQPVQPDWSAPGRAFNRRPVPPPQDEPQEPAPAPSSSPDGFMTVRAAAERLSVDPHVLAEHVIAGRVPAQRRGGKMLIAEDVVAKLEAAMAAAPPKPRPEPDEDDDGDDDASA